jgi:hypothetical protein
MNVPLLIMNAASAGPIVEVVVDGASVAGLEVDTDGAASCWFVSPAHRVPADGVPYLEHGIGSFGAFFAWTAGRPVRGLGYAIHAAAIDADARGRAGGTWLADSVRPVPLSLGEASVVVDVFLRYCDAEALELEGADVGAALARARPAERLALAAMLNEWINWLGEPWPYPKDRLGYVVETAMEVSNACGTDGEHCEELLEMTWRTRAGGPIEWR